MRCAQAHVRSVRPRLRPVPVPIPIPVLIPSAIPAVASLPFGTSRLDQSVLTGYSWGLARHAMPPVPPRQPPAQHGGGGGGGGGGTAARWLTAARWFGGQWGLGSGAVRGTLRLFAG